MENLKKKTTDYADLLEQLDRTRLPRHIGIIMDGNGRWAKRRGLIRSAGHKAGAENLRNATELCTELGIEALTVYAFSTENWQRPQEEVNYLMKLLVEYLRRELPTMMENRVRLRVIGDRSRLSEKVNAALEDVISSTAANDGTALVLALNYGGRDELVRAVRQIVAQGIAPEAIDEAVLSAHLDTAGLPDPDLIIRPSGELRLSNFLPWQAAYSEFYFSDIMWPDFGKRELVEAILAYQKRDRRFGGVK